MDGIKVKGEFSSKHDGLKSSFLCALNKFNALLNWLLMPSHNLVIAYQDLSNPLQQKNQYPHLVELENINDSHSLASILKSLYRNTYI